MVTHSLLKDICIEPCRSFRTAHHTTTKTNLPNHEPWKALDALCINTVHIHHILSNGTIAVVLVCLPTTTGNRSSGNVTSARLPSSLRLALCFLSRRCHQRHSLALVLRHAGRRVQPQAVASAPAAARPTEGRGARFAGKSGCLECPQRNR